MAENNIVTKLRTKLRALIEDLIKSDTEVFAYVTSSIFTLQEENIAEITEVTLDGGSPLGSGEYSFDSSTNKLTIIASLSGVSNIEVIYTYYKYSNTELDEFVRASLVWISIFDVSENDFEMEDDDIYPEPDGRTSDLIVLIASLLVKPDWTEYRLPNLTVRYNQRIPKEDRIEKLINRFTLGTGVNDVLEFD